MSGGTLSHERIMGNSFALFRSHLRGTCETFASDMQIKVPSAPPYRYADGSVVCGKVEVERFNGNDLLVNPLLIFEVLSPSTEAYDRGRQVHLLQVNTELSGVPAHRPTPGAHHPLREAS